MKKKDPLKLFEKYVKQWVDYFGLYFWDVNVHGDDEEDDGSLAYTMTNVNNKRADIYLVMDWGDTEMTKDELNKTAFHEVIEVLLFKIRHIAGKRDIHYDDIDGAIHEVIRILTAKIFETEHKR